MSLIGSHATVTGGLAAVLPLLDKLGDDDPDLLFEPMAGQGQTLCAQAGDLAGYLAAVDHHPKAGICLDTCLRPCPRSPSWWRRPAGKPGTRVTSLP